MLKETILEVYFDLPRHGVLKICRGQFDTLQDMILELDTELLNICFRMLSEILIFFMAETCGTDSATAIAKLLSSLGCTFDWSE